MGRMDPALMRHAGLPCVAGINAPEAMEVVAGQRAKRVIPMTALWISLAVVVALVLGWRLRRATKLLDRILREESERAEREAAAGDHAEPGESVAPALDDHRAEHRNQ